MLQSIICIYTAEPYGSYKKKVVVVESTWANNKNFNYKNKITKKVCMEQNKYHTCRIMATSSSAEIKYTRISAWQRQAGKKV